MLTTMAGQLARPGQLPSRADAQLLAGDMALRPEALRQCATWPSEVLFDGGMTVGSEKTLEAKAPGEAA